ncbi:AI-2E family transporter [Brytella acorum]|uniref:AI-2E family transporter n=1 Tax=Brytella acorum TaxID=2959299 RepID=UPI0025AE13AF|nr:AI-2E family transporter [Brytella acorum]MDF3624345.1 AI-2E family transporter [Brytella acorum]
MSADTSGDLPASKSQADTSYIFRLLRFALIITIVIIAIWLIGDVLTVVFASALVAVVLHGVARALRRRMPFIPYQAAVGIVAALIVLGVIALFYFSGPQIGDQFIKLKQALVTQYGELKGRMSQSSIGAMVLDHLPESLGGNEKGSSGLGNLGLGFANSVTGILSSAFGVIGTLLVILIAGLYFALTPAIYVEGTLRLIPEHQRPGARKLLLVAGRTLWSWTIGQAFDMLVVGVASGIGLAVIGVPLALALGVVAGLCNFIPYIGAIMGAIPAVLIALSMGTKTTLTVFGLYCVIQFLEGNVLAPFIQRHAVHMPPALAILSQTVFGSILGVPGLILASPLTAALLAVGDRATPPLADDMRVGRTVGETDPSDDRDKEESSEGPDAKRKS